MTTENYVEMVSKFAVVETKTGKSLWKDMVSTFIKKKMRLEESIPLVYEKVSRTFLWKSFGKPSAFAKDAIHSR